MGFSPPDDENGVGENVDISSRNSWRFRINFGNRRDQQPTGIARQDQLAVSHKPFR